MEPEGISEIVLAVTDLPQAEAFYAEALGLPVIRRSPNRLWLQAGNALLGLWRAHPDERGAPEEARLRSPRQRGLADAQGGRHVHFALRVPSAGFDETVRDLQAHGVHVREVHRAGQVRSAFFDDPDGNVLEITDAQPGENLPHGRPER